MTSCLGNPHWVNMSPLCDTTKTVKHNTEHCGVDNNLHL